MVLVVLVVLVVVLMLLVASTLIEGKGGGEVTSGTFFLCDLGRRCGHRQGKKADLQGGSKEGGGSCIYRRHVL